MEYFFFLFKTWNCITECFRTDIRTCVGAVEKGVLIYLETCLKKHVQKVMMWHRQYIAYLCGGTMEKKKIRKGLDFGRILFLRTDWTRKNFIRTLRTVYFIQVMYIFISGNNLLLLKCRKWQSSGLDICIELLLSLSLLRIDKFCASPSFVELLAIRNMLSYTSSYILLFYCQWL